MTPCIDFFCICLFVFVMPRKRKVDTSNCRSCPGCSEHDPKTPKTKRVRKASQIPSSSLPPSASPPKSTSLVIDPVEEKANMEAKQAICESSSSSSSASSKKLPVTNPVILDIKKREFDDLGLDPTRQSVIDLKNGPKSTLDAFLFAASRFEAYLSWRKEKDSSLEITFSQATLMDFFDQFLRNLCEPGSLTPVIGPGSYWSVMSLVKRYIFLRYHVDLFDSKELNRHISIVTKSHKPKKRDIFTFAELERFVLNTPHMNPCDLQEKLIAVISFYLLGRSEEIAKLRTEDIFLIDVDNGVIGINLPRCSKTPVITHGFVHSIGTFNVAEALKTHIRNRPLTAPSDDTRIWWQANAPRSKLTAQHMGKRNISKVAKKIASYLEKCVDRFGSHSFRRSGATNLANAGASLEDIMVAGGICKIILIIFDYYL